MFNIYSDINFAPLAVSLITISIYKIFGCCHGQNLEVRALNQAKCMWRDSIEKHCGFVELEPAELRFMKSGVDWRALAPKNLSSIFCEPLTLLGWVATYVMNAMILPDLEKFSS